MIVRTIRRPVLPLLLVATAGLGHAQMPPVEEVSHEISLNSSGTGVYRGTEVGDFDGDGLLDLVTRRGDTLETILGVVALGFTVPDIAPAATFVVRPVTQGLDTVVVSNNTGLHEYSFDPVAGTWSSTSLLTDPTGSHAALDLALRQVASPGDPLVLVQADGLSVQILPTGLAPAMGAPEIVSTRPILRALPFDLDGDGGDELALLHADGVSVFDSSGTPPSETWSIDNTYSFESSDLTFVDATAGAASASGAEWLACLSYAPNGTDQWVTYVSNGASIVSKWIGANAVARLEAGDWNGDGDDDLALSRKVDQRVAVALEQAVGWHDFGSMLLFDLSDTPSTSSPFNDAQPVVTDLNGDGDVDLALAVQPNEELHLEFNPATAGPDSAPFYLTAWDPDGPGLPEPFMNLVELSGETYLHAQFELASPTTWPLIENGSEVPLKLVVHGYARPSSGGAPIFLDAWESSGLLTSTSAEELVHSETRETAGFTTPTYEHYFVVAKYIRVQNGSVTFSSSPLVIGYHATGEANWIESGWTGPGASATQQLQNWGGMGDPIDVFNAGGDGTTTTTTLPPGTPTGSVDPVGGRVGVGMTLVRLPQS